MLGARTLSPVMFFVGTVIAIALLYRRQVHSTTAFALEHIADARTPVRAAIRIQAGVRTHR